MSKSTNVRLGIINSMLRTTGTAPLSGEDTSHPDYLTANAVLDEIIEEISSKPLWFNTSIRTLSPATDGRIGVPSNAISCDPVNGDYNLVVRDRFLFDVDARTYVISVPIRCYIQAELDLADMPPEVIKFLRAEARYRYYLDGDGGTTKLSSYSQKAYNAAIELDAVNIARMDINFFKSRAARQFFTARSSSYQHIGSGGGDRNNSYISGYFTR